LSNQEASQSAEIERTSWSPWFNNYPSDGDGLTREIVTRLDLRDVPLSDWTDRELGFRLAVIYPQVDGYHHKVAPLAIKDEVEGLFAEITRRGYDPVSNLMHNERNKGWGWISGFRRLAPTSGEES
jgi:hypothetical protein